MLFLILLDDILYIQFIYSNKNTIKTIYFVYRFYMYLKLFIIMGITWIMELISWLINVDIVPAIVWYPTYIVNALQGVIIFIIFVCRRKIKQLLLKRFNGYNCGPFGKISMNNDSITNTISTLGSETLNMQEISSSNQQLVIPNLIHSATI